MRFVVLVAALGAGCAAAVALPAADAGLPADAAPSGPRSGTRIKMQMTATADGARNFIGWYDAEMKTPCRDATAADGKIRCLPGSFSEAFVPGDGRRSLLYSDGACQRPVMFFSGCTADTHAFALVQKVAAVPGPCGTGATVDVYAIANPRAATSGMPFFITGSEGDCVLDGALSWDGTLYDLGAKLDPTKFAEFTTVIE